MLHLKTITKSLFWAVLLICSQKLQAQCSFVINNLPDTIEACKNALVQFNPSIGIIGNSPIFLDTSWSPAGNFSNASALNPVLNVGTTSNTYSVTVTGVSAVELISNGNFSSGAIGFTTAYTPGSGGSFGLLSNPGEYAINTNPLNTHVNFASFGDHTSGTGNMLIVNGSSVANINVWCQTISVTPNTWYDFSAWGASCVGSNPAILQFSINGTLIGTPLSLPLATGVWSQFQAPWFSGTNTSITICINDQQTAGSGNDFAIDDIAFREICSVTDSVYVKVINLTPGIATNIDLGCESDTVAFTALQGVGDVPANYFWSVGNGFVTTQQNFTYVYPDQGIYTIKLVTEFNGCKDSTTASVNLFHPLDAGIVLIDTACVDVLLNATNSTITTLPINYTINWGDGVINTSYFHSYSQPGLYTVQLNITDALGCKDSATQEIFIFDKPYVNFTVSDSQVCIGEPIMFTDTVNANTQSFTWDFGDFKQLSNIHNPIHSYEQTQNSVAVTLTGINSQCPSATYTRNIWVYNYPYLNIGQDTSICPDITGPIILNSGGNNYTEMLWNTGNTNSTQPVVDAGVYWFKATQNGCTSSDTIEVKRDCFLNIPNSFTPNSDGLNDYFMPLADMSSGLSYYALNVFNRWGEKIFTTTNINSRGWDGKYGGKLQPVGVYVYTIDAVFNNVGKKTYTGNVTLLR